MDRDPGPDPADVFVITLYIVLLLVALYHMAR